MRLILAAFTASIVLTSTGQASAQYVTYAPGTVFYPAPVYTYAQPAYTQGYRASYLPDRYARPANPTGYRNRPYYGAYGYGNYSNGSTDGFPPFRGRGWR